MRGRGGLRAHTGSRSQTKIRTVILNLSRLRDGYLHTNCMAVLANLSSTFDRLHAHTSQRLFGLLAFLRKRLVGAQSKLAAQASGVLVAHGDGAADDAAAPAVSIVLDAAEMAIEPHDLQGMLTLYEQLLTILLEVMQVGVLRVLSLWGPHVCAAGCGVPFAERQHHLHLLVAAASRGVGGAARDGPVEGVGGPADEAAAALCAPHQGRCHAHHGRGCRGEVFFVGCSSVEILNAPSRSSSAA